MAAAVVNFSPVKTPYRFQFTPKSNNSSCYQPLHIRRQQPHLGVFQPLRVPGHSSSLRLRCEAVKFNAVQLQNSDRNPDENEFDWEIKFGSSSVDSADRIREAAELVCGFDHFIRSFESFEEKRLVIVLPAMGKTTEKLQLAAEKAVRCDVSNVPDLEELTFIRDLHLRIADELGIDREIMSEHLSELEKILKFFATYKVMYQWQIDNAVSLGEHMSARIFAAYLNKIGVKAQEFLKPVKEVFKPQQIAIETIYNPYNCNPVPLKRSGNLSSK